MPLESVAECPSERVAECGWNTQASLPPISGAGPKPCSRLLLRAEGIAARAVYRPGEVCRLLRISPTTLRQFCDLAEHLAVKHPDPRTLESFLVGCHRRISHAALVEWLVRNQSFQRETG